MKNIFFESQNMSKKNNNKYVIWIDEAGRWPWLGPVVAVALCFNPNNLPDNYFLSKIKDSKKINKKNREKIFNELIKLSTLEKPQVFFWLWVVDNFVIDDINIKNANKEAMRRALIELLRKIDEQKIDKVLIDWKDNYDFCELKNKPGYIIWWDWKIIEIWAASIIAKVFRDKIMDTYSYIYPNLGIENHKWYWTKKHSEFLKTKKDITKIVYFSNKETSEKLMLKIYS